MRKPFVLPVLPLIVAFFRAPLPPFTRALYFASVAWATCEMMGVSPLLKRMLLKANPAPPSLL